MQRGTVVRCQKDFPSWSQQAQASGRALKGLALGRLEAWTLDPDGGTFQAPPSQRQKRCGAQRQVGARHPGSSSAQGHPCSAGGGQVCPQVFLFSHCLQEGLQGSPSCTLWEMAVLRGLPTSVSHACPLEAWDPARWGPSPPLLLRVLTCRSGGSPGPQGLVLPMPWAVTLAETFTPPGPLLSHLCGRV